PRLASDGHFSISGLESISIMARTAWARSAVLLAVTFVAGCAGSISAPRGGSVPASDATQPSQAPSPSHSLRAEPSLTPSETAVSSPLLSSFKVGRGVLGLVEAGDSVWAGAY